ncbi:MAG TPA: XRE family transcriptional regulator [Candidatus Aminicenantes bacterium]|nr:XRE family transcriptional regulator [Candidatus Aminicenantes bacterium]
MDMLLGTRLKRAREEVNLSQGAFAKALGLSSEYISLLESGKRTPSFETLLKVAGFLNKNVSYFFEDKRPAFDGLFDRAEADDRLRRDLMKFKATCERYLELEEKTGRRLDLAPRYSRISAERLAEEERRRLGLGNEPIRDVLALCEVNGCRIVRQTLSEEARISGIFVFDEERQAAFALINANEPAGLQTLIAAHLYGHYLMDRADSPIVDNPDVVVDEYVSLYPPREQFAQTFASRFLVPPGKLRELVEKDPRAKSLTFDDVLFLKRYFGVSTRAMLRTLRGRGLLPEARFEEFFKRGPEDREMEVFGGLSGQEERRSRSLFRKTRTILSDRFRLLAAEAAAMDRARRERAPAPPKEAGGGGGGGSDE